MIHPSESTWALYAGGDLGFFAKWRAERHLAGCPACRAEVADFAAMRQILPDLSEIPEIPWNRMAAEMKANIRLGLAAGECVRTSDVPLRETPLFTGARAVVALASVVALMAAGIVLERPGPVVAVDEGTEVQRTANGIQYRKGEQTLRLMNTGAESVTYSVDVQGGVKARYVDPKTFVMTINNVYAEE